MTFNEPKSLVVLSANTSSKEEYSSIPLDISDIINICKDFNNLGWQIQKQIENILEIGVEESIKSGFVKQESLLHIKFFLQQIYSNPYFGDAAYQAQDCIELIQQYEDKYQITYTSKSN